MKKMTHLVYLALNYYIMHTYHWEKKVSNLLKFKHDITCATRVALVKLHGVQKIHFGHFGGPTFTSPTP